MSDEIVNFPDGHCAAGDGFIDLQIDGVSHRIPLRVVPFIIDATVRTAICSAEIRPSHRAFTQEGGAK